MEWLHAFNEWLNELGYALAEMVQGRLESGSLLVVLLVFLAGVVTSFTPCVYPMIPVTITYIGGAAAGSRRRAVRLSSIYVLGLSAVYTALGVASASLGKTFGTLSQSPGVNAAVGALVLGFGLAMLDLFTIPVPQVFGQVQQQGVRRGGHLGALLMGVAAGFVAAPCTAPVLGFLLVFIASGQNVLWGGLLMFAFSLGLGFLLLVVGIFSGLLASLPRAGAWMDWVKRGFGAAMIAVGAFFLWKAVQGWLA